MDGPPRMVAWQPGQVGNEAAIPNNYQCRGFGSSSFLCPTYLVWSLFLARNRHEKPRKCLIHPLNLPFRFFTERFLGFTIPTGLITLISLHSRVSG